MFYGHFPLQRQTAVQGRPASWHLHFLVHRGSALHPHLIRSLLALATSGSNVQTGTQETSSSFFHPNPSGGGIVALYCRHVVQILA